MKKLLTLALLLCFLHTGFSPDANAQLSFDRDDNVKNYNNDNNSDSDEIDFDFDFSGDGEKDEGPKVINPFDDKYKPDLTAEETEGVNLTPNYFYYFTILRKPDASPDDINLFIFSPGTIVGCLSKEPASLETVKFSPTMQIKLTEGQTDVDRETVRYFHYECKPETGMVEMYITLSKKQLIKDKIKKLVLLSEAVGPFSDIIIDFHDNHIDIESKLHDLGCFGLKTHGIPKKFTYWLYPENTMVLFSSSADIKEKKTRDKVIALARRHGLTPLDEIIPEFEKSHYHDDKLFVVDTAGNYKDKLPSIRDRFAFGKIQDSETYFGAKGPYTKVTEKMIYARSPDIHE
ncbi:MAG: hypothetical protein H6859_01435 [Rhodospirillales bacterium]|nr:MAG: hypothetical protein H6859_01435 [Rhodospirillales bacterium]